MKIVQDYNELNLTDVIEVISAIHIADHTIKVSFSDGTEKIVNFKSFLTKSLHPSISKYLEENLFKQFKIVEGNLNWNNYDMIFPIHDLHEGVIE